jgi:hypothetical protein
MSDKTFLIADVISEINQLEELFGWSGRWHPNDLYNVKTAELNRLFQVLVEANTRLRAAR